MFGFFTQETSVPPITHPNSTGKKWLVKSLLISDDVARFMYEHQISMATFGGHGLGGKIALAAASYNLNKATGYFGIASSPMNQYYFEAAREVRRYVESIQHLNLHRGFPSIVGDLKQEIQCPKWRSLFQSNLSKADGSYRWEFNVQAVAQNLLSNTPNSLWDWPTTNGLFTGKAMFAFPEYSRWVHLGTNTLPMLKVCPQLHGFNEGISYVQGDENPQSKYLHKVRPLGVRIRRRSEHIRIKNSKFRETLRRCPRVVEEQRRSWSGIHSRLELGESGKRRFCGRQAASSLLSQLAFQQPLLIDVLFRIEICICDWVYLLG